MDFMQVKQIEVCKKMFSIITKARPSVRALGGDLALALGRGGKNHYTEILRAEFPNDLF